MYSKMQNRDNIARFLKSFVVCVLLVFLTSVDAKGNKSKLLDFDLLEETRKEIASSGFSGKKKRADRLLREVHEKYPVGSVISLSAECVANLVYNMADGTYFSHVECKKDGEYKEENVFIMYSSIPEAFEAHIGRKNSGKIKFRIAENGSFDNGFAFVLSTHIYAELLDYKPVSNPESEND